jgi:hypothetical protein
MCDIVKLERLKIHMADIRKIIDDALATPMSRKQFLGQVGGLLLTVVGVTSIVHALHGTVNNKGHSSGGVTPRAVNNYGSSVYGGGNEHG